MSKLKEQGVTFSLSSDDAKRLLEQVKLMESQGYQYEGAEASFELLAHRSLPDYQAPFELRDFLVVVRRHSDPERGEAGEMLAEAAVKLRVDDETMHTVAEGDGPVNALDLAVRKALTEFHPDLQTVKLVDYKVRIVDSPSGTAAIVRVLLESTDGEHTWTTVGCSPNIIEASWLALSDSLEWWLTRRPKGESRGALPSGGVQGVSPDSLYPMNILMLSALDVWSLAGGSGAPSLYRTLKAYGERGHRVHYLAPDVGANHFGPPVHGDRVVDAADPERHLHPLPRAQRLAMAPAPGRRSPSKSTRRCASPPPSPSSPLAAPRRCCAASTSTSSTPTRSTAPSPRASSSDTGSCPPSAAFRAPSCTRLSTTRSPAPAATRRCSPCARPPTSTS